MINSEFKRLVKNRQNILVSIFVVLLSAACSLYMAYNRTDKTTGLNALELSRAFDCYAAETVDKTLTVLEEKQNAILNLWIDENGNPKRPDAQSIEKLTPVTGSISKELDCISVLCEYARQISEYENYIEGIQSNAEASKQSGFVKTSKYAIRNIENIANRYKDVSTDHVVMYNYFGAEFVLDNSISVFIVLCAALYFSLEIFALDRYDGTFALFKPAKNSKGKLFTAKTITLCSAMSFIFTVIYLINCFVAAKVYGLGDLSVRIQSAGMYYSSPWEISVRGCLILNYAAGLSGTIALTALISLFCMVTTGIIGAAGLTVSVFLAEFAAYRYIPYHSPYSLFSRINLFSIADTKSIFTDYCNINLCSYPVNNVICWFVSLFAALLFGVLLGAEVWCRSEPILKTDSRVGSAKQRRTPVYSSFVFEMRKLLVFNKGLLGLAFLLAVEALLCISFNVYESSSDLWYEIYSEKLVGPYSNGTQKAMDDINAEFEEIRQLIATYREQASTGEISQDHADYMITSIAPDTNQTIGYGKAVNQFAYVKEQTLNENAAEYVLTVPYEKLLDRQEDILCSIPLFLVLSVFIPMYASMEKKYGMDSIIVSSYRGNSNVLKKKRYIVGIFSVMSVILSYLPRVVLKLRVFPLQMLDSPANSLTFFAWAPKEISIIWMLIAVIILRLFVITFYGLLLFSVSRRSARSIFTIIFSVLISILPCLLNLYGYKNNLFLLHAILGLYS